MKFLAGLLAGLVSLSCAAAPAITDQEAQQAHARGFCGTAGPGTGLSPDGRGWVRSMLPGRHEFRMVGGGSVGITVARHTSFDFDIGRPYYIAVDGPIEHLQWRMAGHDWGPVATPFLYPNQ